MAVSWMWLDEYVLVSHAVCRHGQLHLHQLHGACGVEKEASPRPQGQYGTAQVAVAMRVVSKINYQEMACLGLASWSPQTLRQMWGPSPLSTCP